MKPEELRRMADALGDLYGDALGDLYGDALFKLREQAAAALREYAESLELEPKPVASIYISANGNREVDDWRCDLPVGRNILYTHPPRTEPVAYMTEYFSPDCGPQYEIYKADDMGWRNKAEYTPLFTHPPRSEPPKMTESDVRNMAEWWPSFDRAGLRLAIAVVNMRDGQWSALQTKALVRAECVPQWISVDERLPPNDDKVLVWHRFNKCASVDSWSVQREDPLGMGGPTIETGYEWDEHHFEEISHWAPLPAAPGITAPQAKDTNK